MQRETAVTAYLSSKQLLLLPFHRCTAKDGNPLELLIKSGFENSWLIRREAWLAGNHYV